VLDVKLAGLYASIPYLLPCTDPNMMKAHLCKGSRIVYAIAGKDGIFSPKKDWVQKAFKRLEECFTVGKDFFYLYNPKATHNAGDEPGSIGGDKEIWALEYLTQEQSKTTKPLSLMELIDFWTADRMKPRKITEERKLSIFELLLPPPVVGPIDTQKEAPALVSKEIITDREDNLEGHVFFNALLKDHEQLEMLLQKKVTFKNSSVNFKDNDGFPNVEYKPTDTVRGNNVMKLLQYLVFATQRVTKGNPRTTKWPWKKPAEHCPPAAAVLFRTHVKKLVEENLLAGDVQRILEAGGLDLADHNVFKAEKWCCPEMVYLISMILWRKNENFADIVADNIE
jgi:hypothetical protein